MGHHPWVFKGDQTNSLESEKYVKWMIPSIYMTNIYIFYSFYIK